MNLHKTFSSTVATAVFTAAFLISLIGGAFAEEINARNGFSIKAGVDMPGTMDLNYNGSEVSKDMKTGFSGTVEYAKGFNEMFSFGGGVSGQMPRGVDAAGFDGKLGFIDGYGLVNFVIPVKTEGFNFYTSLQLGVSMPFSDDEFKDNLGSDTSLSGDIYWGAAAGVIINRNYIIEAYYKAHHGEVEQGNNADEFEYRHFGVSVGYQF
ncbi:MAG: hypothetical protein CVV49_05400 [Spirochaetae bacterium HGW-Spirochaetae-5]|nr:MAG: hypothetical protein CVV49_05400 [Spirochaetae bacterium HGW-Spirochaetae-5]